MGFLDKFRKKKVEEETIEREEKAEEMSDLEKICMGDKEVYEALRETMLLDPRKVEVSLKEAIKKAKDFEKQKNNLRARTWYEVAGGLAIYEGDVEKVKKCFSKCVELSPESSYAILKIPERAVSKAQEYYQKHLKE
jgi:tetratricopeptide (TPR) repeat protein